MEGGTKEKIVCTPANNQARFVELVSLQVLTQYEADSATVGTVELAFATAL